MVIENWFKRIEGMGGITFDKGELRILNTSNIIFTLNNLVLLQTILKQEFDEKKINSIFYSLGKNQAIMGLNQMLKRFGIKKDVKFLKQSTEQPKTIGYGNLNLIKYDSKNKIIQFKNDNAPIAKKYLSLLGIQKKPVCELVRGSCAGMGEIMFDEECLAIEKVCMSQGNKFCLFEVRPIKMWKAEDPIIKTQSVTKIPLIEEKSKLQHFLKK